MAWGYWSILIFTWPIHTPPITKISVLFCWPMLTWRYCRRGGAAAASPGWWGWCPAATRGWSPRRRASPRAADSWPAAAPAPPPRTGWSGVRTLAPAHTATRPRLGLKLLHEVLLLLFTASPTRYQITIVVWNGDVNPWKNVCTVLYCFVQWSNAFTKHGVIGKIFFVIAINWNYARKTSDFGPTSKLNRTKISRDTRFVLVMPSKPGA